MGSPFEEREVVLAGARHRYRVRVPRSRGRGAPVLLFLHGMGERGRDGARHLAVGLPPRIATSPDDWPFVVVAPQCPDEIFWPALPAQALALAALEDAVRELAADGSRVAVTGLSMGGYGALELAVRRPGRFRALAVVCGGVAAGPSLPELHAELALEPAEGDPYAATAGRLGQVPIWLFHGSEDDVVPVAESRRLHTALLSAGGDVRYTEYAGVGHAAWDRAYGEAELAGWLRGKLGG